MLLFARLCSARPNLHGDWSPFRSAPRCCCDFERLSGAHFGCVFILNCYNIDYVCGGGLNFEIHFPISALGLGIAGPLAVPNRPAGSTSHRVPGSLAFSIYFFVLIFIYI